jgi:hypothetical protein
MAQRSEVKHRRKFERMRFGKIEIDVQVLFLGK